MLRDIVQLNVVPPTPSVNDSSDIARQPAKPLRSALRSTGPKVNHNDVPSKNQSTTSPADKSGRKDSSPVDSSGGGWERAGDWTVDSPGGGTTLSDLKRQRAQTRRLPDGSTSSSPSLAIKSAISSVGNGDVSSADHEPRLRLTSPEFVAVDEKRERSCCVII